MPNTPMISGETPDHRIGYLEGRLQSLEQRMDRRDKDDDEWKKEVSTTLKEIRDNQKSMSGAFWLARWMVNLWFVVIIGVVGWLIRHFFPGLI